MTLLRNFFSGSITFFLVPLLITYLVVTGIFGVLLNHTTFQETLKKNNTYQRLSTKIIPPLIISLASKSESQTVLPPKAIENIISKVDKNLLAADLERVINDIYNFVSTDQANFETKINLVTYTTVIKDNLKPVLIDYYESLPTCDSEAEKLFEANFPSNIKCKSTKVSSAKFIKNLEIDKITSELSNNFPTNLIITEKNVSTYPQNNLFNESNLNVKNQNEKSTLVKIQTAIKNYRSSETLLLSMLIFLVMLLIISRLKSISSGCKWVSSALFSASILPLGSTTLLLYLVKPDFFQSTLIKNFGVSDLNSLISDNLFSFSQEILKSIQFKSFIVIVIAIALYGSYLLLGYLKNHKANNPLDVVSKSTHNIS